MATASGDYTATLPRKRMGAAVLFTDAVEAGADQVADVGAAARWVIAALRAKAEGVVYELENGSAGRRRRL